MSTAQRVSRGFHRLGIVTALSTMIFIPSISFSNEKITFICSGTHHWPSRLDTPDVNVPSNANIQNKSLIIDLDQGFIELDPGLVTSFFRGQQLPITEVTDKEIRFAWPNYGADRSIFGSIDMNTGDADVLEDVDDLWARSELKCLKSKL
jgi:hypothetical protein